mgnify:CR=1 FL=1
MSHTEEQATPCPLCSESRADSVGQKNGYPIVRCVNCGLIYLSPMPAAEEIAAMYDDYDPTQMYLGKYSKKILTATFKQKLAARHLDSGSRRCLDIGCNLGAVCEAARRQGFDATGSDLDEATLAPLLAFRGESFPPPYEIGEKFQGDPVDIAQEVVMALRVQKVID